MLTDTGVTVKVIMGELGGTASPADVYSPLVGAEAVLSPARTPACRCSPTGSTPR